MYYILQPIGDEFKTRFSIFRDDCSYVRLNMGNVPGVEQMEGRGLPG